MTVYLLLSCKYDLVISNPPSIPQSDMSTLTMDVIQYESHTAIFGGVDGLDIIQSNLEQLPTLCRSGAICWMEERREFCSLRLLNWKRIA
jgi:release factor glutamine methyltransferase